MIKSEDGIKCRGDFFWFVGDFSFEKDTIGHIFTWQYYGLHNMHQPKTCDFTNFLAPAKTIFIFIILFFFIFLSFLLYWFFFIACIIIICNKTFIYHLRMLINYKPYLENRQSGGRWYIHDRRAHSRKVYSHDRPANTQHMRMWYIHDGRVNT